jgi:NhaA family Na+:H+ antiporter
MATDIAFVVGCLALLGPRVPAGLKIFLLSLAIIDDILAVLVIAIFFTTSINAAWLAGAAAGFGLIGLLNRLGVRRVTMYALVGVGIWLCTLKSGVHPTVAGALLGLLTPASAWLGSATLLEVVQRTVERLRNTDAGGGPGAERREAAEDLAFAATESVSPLERLEHGLHPWVSFAIMPLFALANAGVAVSLGGVTHPIATAVVVGLVAGKPLGIVLASWLVVRLALAKLPEATSWTTLVGAGCPVHRVLEPRRPGARGGQVGHPRGLGGKPRPRPGAARLDPARGGPLGGGGGHGQIPSLVRAAHEAAKIQPALPV